MLPFGRITGYAIIVCFRKSLQLAYFEAFAVLVYHELCFYDTSEYYIIIRSLSRDLNSTKKGGGGRGAVAVCVLGGRYGSTEIWGLFICRDYRSGDVSSEMSNVTGTSFLLSV